MSKRTQQRGLKQHTIINAEQDAEAARLRAQGLGFRQIAEHQGCSLSVAHERVYRAIAAVPVEAVGQLRAVENARLDELTTKLWDILTAVHPLVSHGKLMKNDDGHVLLDDGPVIAAANSLLRVMERRARLNGLDAPMQHDVKVSDAIDADIERLVAELAGMAGRSQAALEGPSASRTVGGDDMAGERTT